MAICLGIYPIFRQTHIIKNLPVIFGAGPVGLFLASGGGALPRSLRDPEGTRHVAVRHDVLHQPSHFLELGPYLGRGLNSDRAGDCS